MSPQSTLLGLSVLGLAFVPGALSAVEIFQTTNAGGGVYWNAASNWGGTAPTAGNTYVSTASLIAPSTISGLSISGRLRDNGSTFAGDSLRLVSGTELLLKQPYSLTGATSTGNIILDGGLLRWAADGNNNLTTATAGVAGTINVLSESYIGNNNNHLGTPNGFSNLTFSSTFSGSATLNIRNANNNNTVTLAGNMSAFTGNIVVGGTGSTNTRVSFNNSAYSFAGSLSVLSTAGSLSFIDLAQGVSFAAVSFNGTPLAPGTYSATDLNTFFSTSNFSGAGLLTAVPEPSTYAALAGLCALGLAVYRRRRA